MGDDNRRRSGVNVTITPTDELQANHPDSEDVGPIELELKRDDTRIHLELGKPVEWLRMTPSFARVFAQQLITLAGEIDKGQHCITPHNKN